MIIVALDLIDNKVVRLKQGDYEQKTVFNYDPLELIVSAYNQGAKLIHIVDLDGAKDTSKRQSDFIESLVKKSPLPIQTGGGIRSYDDVADLLKRGVERVVIGSMCVNNTEETIKILKDFGSDKICLALDVRVIEGVPYVATHGWLQTSSKKMYDLIDFYLQYNLKHILVTDISKDGMLSGPNVNLYQNICVKYPQLNVIASGGVSSLDDIKALKKVKVPSVILGKSLLVNKFTVKEAIECYQNA